MSHALSILLLVPAVGAIVVACLPARAVRWTALAIAILTCLWSFALLLPFSVRAPIQSASQVSDTAVLRLVERVPWIARYHIDYLVGIDGLSLPLVLLTTFIFVIAVIASWKIEKAFRLYFPLLLILESAIVGTFISLDCVLFCAFFELSLMPIYLLIGCWGGPRKGHGALKFFLSMLGGSLVMLAALILIYLNVHSFNLIELPALIAGKSAASGSFARWSPVLFVLILFASFIKSAAAPFQMWLTEAQVEAPGPISIILSAVLLKSGTYAMFRIAYPLFPEAARHLWLPIALVGVVGILYGALCALAQSDLKRLLVYGSISQTGFVILGAAMLTTASFDGAFFMMVAHGVVVAMMFFIAEVIVSRANHREISLLGGLATTMPRFWGFAAAGFFASLGLPGFCLFIAELLVLLGTFAALRSDSILMAGNFARRATIYTMAILALIGIILIAACMLWAMQRIFFGPERVEHKDFPDTNDRETTVLACLAGMAILLGVFPGALFFSMTNKTVDAMFGWLDPRATQKHVATDSTKPIPALWDSVR